MTKMDRIQRIVVHHSATQSGNTELFRLLHRGVNKWDDVGYHFVIGNGTFSGDGEIEKGRPLPYRGAHAKGGNDCSVGICLVGNFNEKPPTNNQMKSLSKLLLRLMRQYKLTSESITIHRHVQGSYTECPGVLLTMSDLLLLIED